MVCQGYCLVINWLSCAILLQPAEIYMENGLYVEAQRCIQESSSIYPLSYLSSYMVCSTTLESWPGDTPHEYNGRMNTMAVFVYQRGRILESQQNYSDAKYHFEAALSINPYHVKSMTYLVSNTPVSFPVTAPPPSLTSSANKADKLITTWYQNLHWSADSHGDGGEILDCDCIRLFVGEKHLLRCTAEKQQ